MSPIPVHLLLTATGGMPPRALAAAPIQQDTLTVKEAEPGLKANAKIRGDRAMKVALVHHESAAAEAKERAGEAKHDSAR